MIRKTAILIYIIFSILLSAASVSASSSVRLHSTGAGIGTVNLCSLRDKYGFLWIGTTSGLACFDGNGYPVNGNPSGIIRSTSNIKVNSLFEHGDDIWFTTPTALMVFDRKQNRISRFPYKTKYNVEIASHVDRIATADYDHIWIVTQGQGLFIFDTKSNTLTQDSRHGSFFSDVTLGNDGYVYAAALNGEIKKFNPKGELAASYSIPGYTSHKSRVSLETQGPSIWITSGSDLYHLDTKTGAISHKMRTDGIGGTINAILNNAPDNLLLGTPAGIWNYNTANGNFERLSFTDTRLNPIPFDSRINQLTMDSDGNVIVVSPGGGINVLCTSESPFRFIPVESTYNPHNFVYSLCADTKARGLWVGSDMGLSFYNSLSGDVTFGVVPAIKGEPVSAISTDGDMLWVGTARNGLFLHNTATGETEHFNYNEDTPYSLMSDEISDIFITSTGETYVLTQWGICRYEPTRKEFYTLAEMGQQNQVVTMAEDRRGNLWASTVNEGLFILKPGEKRFTPYPTKTLDKSIVNIMILGRDGTLWAATQQDGIFRFDNKTKDFVKMEIPLLANRPIMAMEEDAAGTLWIVSGQALVQITKEGKVDFNFSRLVFQSPVLRSSALLPNGDIAFGCSNGFQIFNPANINLYSGSVSTFPTSISFPLMKSDEEALESLGVNVLLYTTQKITLPYDHNTFTIHLSANHPAEVPAVNYDYMLEGVDKNWNVGNAQSEVTYNNLAPGTYRFLVRPSGIPNADSRVLIIKILPPWYRSIWAYIVYGLIVIGAVVIAVIISRRAIRKHYARSLENMRVKKEREAWESKMRFFVDLVHEIRTPLMLISLPLEHLSKQFKDVTAHTDMLTNRSYMERHIKAGRRYLGSMQNNLNYLLGITNQLLDFRKIANDNELNMNFKRCNLNTLLSEVLVRFKDPMETEHKDMQLLLPAKPLYAVIDEEKTDRVLMNLLGNALKYCKTKVMVTLTEENGKARISIADDGNGIPQAERENIFERYYQIKNDKIGSSLGTGLGLAYAKMIVKNHEGDIEVTESTLGGADFILTLPLESETAKGLDLKDSDEKIADPASGPADAANGNLSKDTDNSESSTAESADAEKSEEESSGEEIWKENTVLVVDDNKELRDMICEGLENNYNVVSACDGVDALEILKDIDVDFIVSDVMMPRMDGIELLRKVKEDINTCHIPFIILTAKTSQEAREEGMTHGADVYLDKPFSIQSLILQIENIRRTRQFFYQRLRGTEPMPVVEEAQKQAVEEEKLPAVNKYDREFMDKLNAKMEENFSNEDFTIDDLAEHLNMSRSSFYRKLKALMGMTPVDYMKNYRLDAAARMLREGTRVTEVVYNVGFSSSSYFAKCFKEKYGVLPRDYVASLQ